MTDTIPTARTGCVAVLARVTAYVELIRPRIAALVLTVTLLGFTLAPFHDCGLSPFMLLIHTLVGTAMVAGGASALNQSMEADYDRRMVRTMKRPVPSGRLRKTEAMTFGLLIGVGGVAYLAGQVNYLAAILGGIALATYVLLYTPLKRCGWQSVFIGAVTGAMPPVIGWAGAAGSLAAETWFLFAIIYVWQLPHFATIAWLHREDYRRAGFPMLSVIDAAGTRTCQHMLLFSMLLLGVSLAPALYGVTGALYAAGAGLSGVAFTGCGFFFARSKSTKAARFHLLASVVYLPTLFLLMILDGSWQ